MSSQPAVAFSAELARITKVMDRTKGELMERETLVTDSSVVPATPDAVSLGDLAYGDRSLHHGITPVSMRTPALAGDIAARAPKSTSARITAKARGKVGGNLKHERRKKVGAGAASSAASGATSGATSGAAGGSAADNVLPDETIGVGEAGKAVQTQRFVGVPAGVDALAASEAKCAQYCEQVSTLTGHVERLVEEVEHLRRGHHRAESARNAAEARATALEANTNTLRALVMEYLSAAERDGASRSRGKRTEAEQRFWDAIATPGLLQQSQPPVASTSTSVPTVGVEDNGVGSSSGAKDGGTRAVAAGTANDFRDTETSVLCTMLARFGGGEGGGRRGELARQALGEASMLRRQLATAKEEMKALRRRVDEAEAAREREVTARRSHAREASVVLHKQQQQLVGAVRRIHYVLSQREKAEAEARKQRSYVVQLEHKLLQHARGEAAKVGVKTRRVKRGKGCASGVGENEQGKANAYTSMGETLRVHAAGADNASMTADPRHAVVTLTDEDERVGGAHSLALDPVLAAKMSIGHSYGRPEDRVTLLEAQHREVEAAMVAASALSAQIVGNNGHRGDAVLTGSQEHDSDAHKSGAAAFAAMRNVATVAAMSAANTKQSPTQRPASVPDSITSTDDVEERKVRNAVGEEHKAMAAGLVENVGEGDVQTEEDMLQSVIREEFSSEEIDTVMEQLQERFVRSDRNAT